jgi:hypothetical protein
VVIIKVPPEINEMTVEIKFLEKMPMMKKQIEKNKGTAARNRQSDVFIFKVT